VAKRTLAPETIAKWRAAALKNQPWKRSTGPKTAEGKAQAARNGKSRQRGGCSYRELFAFAKALRQEVRAAAAFRKEAAKAQTAKSVERPRPSGPGDSSFVLAKAAWSSFEDCGSARAPSSCSRR
jgi:hypothetical protein